MPVEGYQAERAQVLSWPEGVGKRYNFADIQRFIVESEAQAKKPGDIAVTLTSTEFGTTVGDIEGLSFEEASRRLLVIRENGNIDPAILWRRGANNQPFFPRALIHKGDRVALLNKERNGAYVMTPVPA